MNNNRSSKHRFVCFVVVFHFSRSSFQSSQSAAPFPKGCILASVRSIAMTILRFARHEIIEALIKLSSEETTSNPYRSSVESVHQIVSFLASDCFGFSYTIISVKNCTISQLYAIFMFNNFNCAAAFQNLLALKIPPIESLGKSIKRIQMPYVVYHAKYIVLIIIIVV